MPKAKPLLTVSQAAELRPDLGANRIRKYCERGQLPAYRLSDLLPDRVPKESLCRDAWLIEPAVIRKFVPRAILVRS